VIRGPLKDILLLPPILLLGQLLKGRNVVLLAEAHYSLIVGLVVHILQRWPSQEVPVNLLKEIVSKTTRGNNEQGPGKLMYTTTSRYGIFDLSAVKSAFKII
jgi:hypothetical protein